MQKRTLCFFLALGGCATGAVPYEGPVTDQSFTVVGESSAAICTGRYVRMAAEIELITPISCNDGRAGNIAIRTSPDGHPLLGTASLSDGSTAHIVFRPLLADRHAHGRSADLRPSRRAFGEREATTAPRAPATYRHYIRGPRGGCYYINSSGNKTYVDRSFCR